jgi:rhodanese-related sulfurtransferase
VFRALIIVGSACVLLALGVVMRPVGEEPVAWESVRGAIARHFPGVDQLATEELAAWLADASRPAPVLVDTRTAGEYAISRLPGALHAENAEALRGLLAGVPRDRSVVLYCSVGWRSSALAAELTARGEGRDFRNLDGSLFEWANEGRPLVDLDGAPVFRAHPFDARWGRLLDTRYHPETFAW